MISPPICEMSLNLLRWHEVVREMVMTWGIRAHDRPPRDIPTRYFDCWNFGPRLCLGVDCTFRVSDSIIAHLLLDSA